MTLEEFLLARVAEDRGASDLLTSLPYTFNPDLLDHWTVKGLATVYADHPDYREEWRP